MYNPTVSYYITGMESEILFVPSAFKHGATRKDIRHAHDTRIKVFHAMGCRNSVIAQFGK